MSMQAFEKRRDRYELFAAFEKPLVNLGFELETPDFRPWCKARQLPPFHFFLYCVLMSVMESDNFMYREFDGQVLRIDRLHGSYTVINGDGNLNFTRFAMTPDLRQFVANSLAAKRVAEASTALINTGAELSPRERKNSINITCMPWLKLASVEHPVYRHGAADIPSLAWGRFSDPCGAPSGARMTLPFSVQAHHGFVDGYHVHLLAQAISHRIAGLIAG